MVMRMLRFLSHFFLPGISYVQVGWHLFYLNCNLAYLSIVSTDRKILLLGIVQALFEASMYVFILEWTPALTNTLKEYSIDKTDSSHPPIPHGKIKKRALLSQDTAAHQLFYLGYIFASYMVAMMMGSNSFKIFSKYVTPDALLMFVCLPITTEIDLIFRILDLDILLPFLQLAYLFL